jgi:hypothetical protein
MLNLSLYDTEPIWYRTYQISNLSDTEPIWCQTYLIPNLWDTEPIRSILVPSLPPSSQWLPTPPAALWRKWWWNRSIIVPSLPPSSQWLSTPPSAPCGENGDETGIWMHFISVNDTGDAL